MTHLNHQAIVLSFENDECIRNNYYCFESADGIDTSIAHYGSGLVFNVSKQWFLRGISVVFSAPAIGCNKTLWIIDVPSHYDWIMNEIKKFV